MFKRVDPDIYKINPKEYFRLQEEAKQEATQNKQNYIKQLYSDLQNFKNSQQTLQNNVLYQMNNNQFNNPTYSTGMDNNVFDNNEDNLNTSSLSNNADFCNLTNCTCCGCKLW